MCGLDMAWDAMHHADDKFMVLKTPGQVAEIARALPERAKEGENRKA
ncbi:MAG: hypothetical protein HFH42_12765 [Lachnospiraceae bacterium]|nr:hypothetical protein [Lachnospiraceae bacterium]